MRVRQGLVLARQRGGGHLGNHKPGVNPAVAHQERWQLGHVFIHHQRDTTLRQCANFGNRQGQIIRRHRHRFGVEVTPGDHFVFRGEHQRVIGNGIGFNQQYLRHLAHLGKTGPHYLRLTAQGVRVLHLVAVVVRLGNGAGVGQDVAEQRRGVDLPALAAYLMNAGVKRTTGAEHRFGSQRPTDHRRGKQIFGFKQAAQGKGGGGLGAVQQRQPLFRRQRHRGQTRFLQGGGGR